MMKHPTRLMNSNHLASFFSGLFVAVLAVFAWHYFSAHAPFSNLSVTPENSADNIFQVASSTGETYLTVKADGKVGVNTVVPQTTLDIRGMARIYTSSTTPCTKDIEGAIAYNPRTQHFLGCNAEEWRRLDN